MKGPAPLVGKTGAAWRPAAADRIDEADPWDWDISRGLLPKARWRAKSRHSAMTRT
jgi:hypothetical protein